MARNQMRAWGDAGAGMAPAAPQAVMNQLLGWCFAMLCAMIFFLVAFPSYGELKIGGSPNMAPGRLLRVALLGLMTLIMLIKPFRQKLTRQEYAWSKATYYIVVAFWLWTVPLVLFNGLSFGYILSKFKNEILPVWLSFWLTVALVKREAQLRWIVRALALATVSVLITMGFEVAFKRNVFEGLLQVDNLSTGAAFLNDIRDGRYRAKGTFQHPLVLAHFLISFGLLFTSIGIFHPKPWKGGLPWWLLGMSALGGVYFTNTRSGLSIGLLFLIILLTLRYLAWLKAMRSRLMSSILALQLLWLPVLMIVGVYVAQELVQGRTMEERSSTSSRMIALDHGLRSIMDSPLIGYGIGMGDIKGGVSLGGGVGFSMDNLFLLQALDNGIPATLLLLAVFGVSAWRMLPHWSELRPSSDVGLRLGMTMLFVSTIAMYGVYALSDLFELFFVLVAALLCLPGRNAKRVASPRGGR